MKRVKIFLEMIKFEHSVFALPFAYLGMVLAARGFPDFGTFLWVTIAMVSLRTAAMSINRLIDHHLDSENPRTRTRALPKGLLTRRATWTAAGVSLLFFIFATSQLNSVCFSLSPIPVLFIAIYPYLKRWTWISHWVLGFILGMAPYGGWLAVEPEWSWVPALLTIAVTGWVGGFDIFYSLQDVSFDKMKGLKSLPTCFGVKEAVFLAKSSQWITVCAFVVLGFLFPLGVFYWIGIFTVTGLIYYEHRLIAQFGLTRIHEAFFDTNAWVSVVIFLATFLDVLIVR